MVRGGSCGSRRSSHQPQHGSRVRPASRRSTAHLGEPWGDIAFEGSSPECRGGHLVIIIRASISGQSQCPVILIHSLLRNHALPTTHCSALSMPVYKLCPALKQN